MSEETAVVTEPVDDTKVIDDAKVVMERSSNDDPVISEQKIHEDLVAAVAKKLEGDSSKPEAGETKQPDEKSEKPGKPEVTPKGESAGDGEGEKEAFSEALQTRVKGAGLTEDLAQQLHQSGQLEETLAASDRRMIEYVQSKEDSKGKAKEPPKAEVKELPEADDQEVPALDPDVYDEELVKRDAYQQKRIDALEAQIQGLAERQSDGFDEWMDGALTELGVDTSDEEKCQIIWKAYGSVCDVFGKDPATRDKAMVGIARTAMYPKDVFKQQQRQMVDRLRDSEGKLLSPSKSQGGPPPKGSTDEEVHSQLVSNVGSYLKEQGVEMSGY